MESIFLVSIYTKATSFISIFSQILLMDSSFTLTTIPAAIALFTLVVTMFLFCRKFIFHQANITTTTPSSLALSSPPLFSSHNRKHHVFPSFHGEDVRKSILSHILKEFKRKGIDAFIDNDIERSKSIGPELIDAIRGSRIAIVLLSRNYASSTWCLNELVEIMKCREEFGKTVMSIFYDLDPTDVKKQTGDFGKVFRKTCKGKTKEEMERWSHYLTEVAKIAGYGSHNWVDEATMIEEITSDISNKLNMATPSSDVNGLVGMGVHMERMEQLLRLDLDEVRMIGIWGPLGIGKSTIARFLFNQISSSFQLSAIMVNIKGSYPKPCLDEGSAQIQLQNQMLSQMINHKGCMITHLGIARERLKDSKVFLVLDDVDRLAQLNALAKEVQWFGPKSRIIITTEDLRVLKAHGINHIYKLDFPSIDEALQMFCVYAFDQKFPKDGYTELAHEATYLSGKLPLALKVMGSYFRRMSKQEWTNALPKLRRRLDGEITNVLKFSYDALCEEDKVLFLHIACFFDYTYMERLEEYLANSFIDVRQGLRVLADKSLISIEWGRIKMHNLLVQLGKEIVRQQSIRGQRQFMFDAKDIYEVLTDHTTIKSVIGLNLSYVRIDDKLSIRERVFGGMSNLQFIRTIGHFGHPDIMSSLVSPNIRFLDWGHSPITSLPITVNLEFLVELRMVYSKLEKLWDGIKLLGNLKWMNLSFSVNFKELPDLLTATSLKELILCGCLSLIDLPISIGNATNLEELNLSSCSSLVKLPSTIGNATNLQTLDLSYCSSLVELPSSIGNLTNLQKLNLNSCSSLLELPSSIGTATNLQDLYLSSCSSLVKLPSSIGNLTNLQTLDLTYCSSLVELPFSVGNVTNLQKVYLGHCSSLVELPYSIGNLANLQELNLGFCSSLVKLPPSIGNVTNLQELDLTSCSNLVKLPSSIGNLTLTKFYLKGCL